MKLNHLSILKSPSYSLSPPPKRGRGRVESYNEKLHHPMDFPFEKSITHPPMSLPLYTPKGKAEANSLINDQVVLPGEDRETLESDPSASGSPSRGAPLREQKPAYQPGKFDVKRDNELIAAGTHFWCESCLVAKPLDDQSPDYRYCVNCYDFLQQEFEILKESHPIALKIKRPDWIPGEQKAPTSSPHMGQNLSTLNEGKIEVDIIQPSVAKVTTGKRGPKPKVLPHELIKQWAVEGMGSKAIASKLKADRGIIVSYKTIQRILVVYSSGPSLSEVMSKQNGVNEERGT